jgi:hypothetical protein
LSAPREPANAVDETDNKAGGAQEMSDNYSLYVRKMAERRVSREADRPLRREVEALFEVVRECEARWALEDRIGGV